METDLNSKYDLDEANEGDINSSKKRSALINPYLPKQKNENHDP